MELEGIRVTLSDTAGIRERAERVEALGIARSEETLAESPVAIWVVDGSQPLAAADRAVASRLAGKHVIVALNKCDLAATVSLSDAGGALAHAGAAWWRCASVSALRGEGLAALRAALLQALGGGAAHALDQAVSNVRHVEALARAQAALERAQQRGREGAPGEIVAIEVREGLAAIGEVTGESVDADLLDRIFSRFCVGK